MYPRVVPGHTREGCGLGTKADPRVAEAGLGRHDLCDPSGGAWSLPGKRDTGERRPFYSAHGMYQGMKMDIKRGCIFGR